ncbi:unnamed protein product [Allacma fusca]|uniref:RING-type domain-containing protein n=1 Tax=Allacma fusca TaxID=39272 RepID=A0A8J2NX77_9HEXA|nr:unnamed protein product [Allacma fusca]
MPTPAVVAVARPVKKTKKQASSVVTTGAVKRKISSVDVDRSTYLFECPMCFENFTCEIFQCVNGHLFCKTCVLAFTKCPSCQVSMTKKIRNRAMEEMVPMVSHFCPNQHLGCSIKCKLNELDMHVSRDCRFTSRLICNSFGLKCSATVKMAELAIHLKEHGIQGCDGNEVILQPDARYGISWKNRKQPVQTLLVYLSTFENIFTVTSVVDFIERSVSFIVRVVGNEKIAKRFAYKIELRPSDAERLKEPNISATTHEGQVLCYEHECGNLVLNLMEKSLLSIPLSKLEVLSVALYSMKVSIKPLVSNAASDGAATVRCNWVENALSRGTPSTPLSPKTPNDRIPRTVTLRRKALTK